MYSTLGYSKLFYIKSFKVILDYFIQGYLKGCYF